VGLEFHIISSLWLVSLDFFFFFSIFLRSWWSSFSSPAHLITYGKCNEIRTRMIITACVLTPHDRKHEGRPQIITKHPEKKKWKQKMERKLFCAPDGG
jgi:hypothetical protein